ncbi:hypothetical protein Celal_3327 [Cellulophaga algicola DSM 14237]|uniref:Uncharacterized protein n=1 Tax=Cellulophaga algicola (strain DSM 14237 / IC166 / ACAM 630) TaxID=688270 RepID=E6X634_CELAD|nr:hypothetical protein [Cellulophaga algicola]ADV50593.1 hypothetical protein Celal_3327 [Cellulophaga algicola DSM 14237]
MKSKLLHIELLKFLIEKSNFFGFVEIKSFLLDNFPEESDLRERRKMKDFLKFLSLEEYVEIQSKRGIWIIVEAGIKVAREDVSAIIKIKPKGVNLVEQNELNRYSKNGIILSSILGLSTLFLAIYSIIITHNISKLENINSELNKENTVLKATNSIIKLQLTNKKIETVKDSSGIEKKVIK